MTLDSINNVMYLGGEFTQATPSPALGSFTGFSMTTGIASLPSPTVNGIVHTTLPDGSGGWYIGGTFTTVNGQARPGLARIAANGTLLPLALSACNGTIHALARQGNTLYLAGSFSSVNGSTRNRLCAIDVNTGVLTSFAPNVSYTVNTMLIYNSRLFIGGGFSYVNATSRDGIAAFDLPAHTLSSWQIEGGGVGGSVYHMVQDGSFLYLGGVIVTLGGNYLPRNNLAAVNINTGATTSWNPSTNEPVNWLEVDGPGNVVYIGGDFTTVNGSTRRFAAAVSISTSGLYTWNAQLLLSGWQTGRVRSLAKAGNVIFLAGTFTSAGGQSRNSFAAVSADLGTVLPWTINCTGVEAGYSVRVSGSEVFLSNTSTCGSLTRQRLAAVNATTGQLLPWDPSANNTVLALANTSGTVYAGGSFTTIGTETRTRLAAISKSTALPLASWTPAANAAVHALVAGPLGLTAGGAFTSIAGVERSGLARLSFTNGTADSFDPSVSGSVFAMALAGGDLWFGGSFTSVSGQLRSNLALVDHPSGTLSPVDVNVNSLVNALALAEGRLYLGGSFTSVMGSTRQRLAAIDPASGSLLDWAPVAAGQVHSLATGHGNAYAGGAFTTVNSQPFPRLVALRPTSALPLSWAPAPNNTVFALHAAGPRLYVGGSFTTISGLTRGGFAMFGIHDCLGQPAGTAVPGLPCDDNDQGTAFDTWTVDCTCVGELITDVRQPEPEADGLRAWPNPAKDVLHLSETVAGVVLDLSGRPVQQLTNSRTLHLAPLAPGAYLLRTNDGRMIRFVKEQ
jgi:trimeric autotransporter adhesin